jgi:phage baseplate assembly protein W
MATRNTRQFTDFNLLFTSHPVTADVTIKSDEEAVKQSLRNLISTRHYERPFHPEIGCQIHALLFENFNPVTAQVMKKTIFDTINKFEPRVTILDVKIRERADNNDITCDLIFRLNNSDRPITLTTLITRVR